MPVQPPRPTFRTVALAALMVCATALLRAALDSLLKSPLPFIFFVIPVLLAAWYGGYKTGIFSTLLSILVGWYFFVPPNLLWVKGDPDILIRIGVFTAIGITISLVVDRLHWSEMNAQVSGQLFRSAFHNAAVGMAHVGTDGRWLRVNQRLCDLVGYPEAELTRKTFQDITHPEDTGLGDQMVRELLAGARASYVLEKRYLRKDGSVVWVNVTGSLQRRSDGRPDFFISVIEDITARKQAEKAQKLNFEQLQAAFAGMVEPALMFDTEGRVILANSGYLQLFGYDRVPRNREEILHDFEFLKPDGSELGPEDSAWARAIKGEVVRDLELKACRRPMGRWFEFLTGAAPIRDAQGQVVAVIVTSHDITQRKRAEIALQRSNLVLRQFAYAAAHDLQEPLRNVALATDLLLERFEGTLGREADRLLYTSVEGARRMHRMIEDLLVYTGTVDSEPREAPMVRADLVLDVALDHLRQKIESSGAIVTRDSLPSVRVYETHLVQLFQNLLSNSLKYTRQGEAPRVHVSAQPMGSEWVFSVRDEGIGFDAAYKEQVFRLFARLHTRREYAGNGIGLAICARIVEQYGGRIWADAEVGKGATFYFTLPAFGIMTAPAA